MRTNDGALPADWLVAFLAEIFEGIGMKGAVFVLVIHRFIIQNIRKGLYEIIFKI